MNSPLTEETGRLLLAEIKKLTAMGFIKKTKPNWKSAFEISKLTVWTDNRELIKARRNNLVSYEVERQSAERSEKTRHKSVYRYDYNSVAPEYRTDYQSRKTAQE